jgi:hypothetical protein
VVVVVFSGPLRTRDAALAVLQRVAGIGQMSSGDGLPFDGD